MKLFSIAFGIVSFLTIAPVYSAQILFEFSGQFGECEPPNCLDTELAELENKTYSGSLLIPTSAPNRKPDWENRPYGDGDDWLLSFYELEGPEARLTFDTFASSFDIFNQSPVTATVSFCDTSQCAANRNFVWFSYSNHTYTFNLNFGSLPELEDRSTKIPDIGGYAAFRHLSFDINRNDDFSFITTESLSPTETNMVISITAVPLPPAIVYFSASISLLFFRLKRNFSAEDV